ncbi:MAG: universal stress protein [Actinomycetota bacterium]|nr:universal stress protein [Actinomycetota bacterium]
MTEASGQHDSRPKLVIGYDGRNASEDALALGADLCRLLDARPLVLSVAPWPRFMHGEDLKVALELDTGEALQRAAAELSDLDPIVKAVAHRSAAEEIGLVARAEEALAIVVGASHRGAVGRIVLGSVGTSLLHGAPCAVAVAPTGYKAGAAGPPKRVGVALDDSPDATSVLDAGILLAGRAGGTLSIFSVAETDFYYQRAIWPAIPLAEMIEFEREQAQRILDAAVARTPDGLAPEAHLLEGSAREALAEATESCDVMIVGSRGHGPLGQTFLGSVSAALIDGSRCPVVVLPRSSGLERHPPAAGAVAESSS